MVSRAPSPDNGESLFNDGKGLQFQAEISLLPKAGAKRRANAKPTIVKKTFYVHEESELNDLIRLAITALGRVDDLAFSWNPREDKYTSTTIDIPGMTYSLPKTQMKSISITCNADYETMITHAKKKPAETTRFCFAELKNCNHGDDDDDSSGDEQAKKKKKKKSFDPTDEELEQNEMIAKLRAEWKCEDRKCKKFLCYPDRVSAKHVHLTHMHLSTWAAAMQGKIVNADGLSVDLKNPPDSKMFSHQDSDEEDQALLRGRAAQKSATKDPNITINLSLPESLAPSAALRPQLTQPAPQRPAIAPKMPLEDFCKRYDISPEIEYKLAEYSVTGPHTLRHLGNRHLEEGAGLGPAEIADVRDAQDRWIDANKENM